MNTWAFRDFDLLWLQSIPSIAAIFYQKYLKNTHVLYCPDDVNNTSQQQPREIGKHILYVMNSNDKQVAIHFMVPLTEKRRQTIFNVIKKSRPTHSSYCLSITSTCFQSNLLLGWSAEIKDDLWKRRCKVEFDPEHFSGFLPLTIKNGQSERTEFMKEFVVSRKKFSKKAMIVDLSESMANFQVGKGLCFKEGVADAIKGWISASLSEPSTLVWIIKEKSLYGDVINNKLQERREKLLSEYRKSLLSSIELFASDIPIYCYIIDYFTKEPTCLSNCLAQIQHRHHICISKSILLKFDNDNDNDELMNQDYFSNMKCIYLKTFALFNESKWRSIFLSYFKKEVFDNNVDKIDYILPEILLQQQEKEEQYKIPLLLSNFNIEPLTKSEIISIDDDTNHTVSAKSLDVFDKWVKMLINIKEEDVNNSNNLQELKESSATAPNILEQISKLLDTEKIKNYINNQKVYKRGELIQDTVSDTQYEIDLRNNNNNLKLYANVKGTAKDPYLVSVTINQHAIIEEISCPCPVGTRGDCKHCAAVLIYFMENSKLFTILKLSALPNISSSSLSSSSSLNSGSSASKKRSLQESREDDLLVEASNDEKEGKKKKSIKNDEYDSDATAPYDSKNDDNNNSSYTSTIDIGNSTISYDYQVYTANATLSQNNNSLSVSSSSSSSLPPVLPSVAYEITSSRSLNSSSLSSSKKSSMSLPTLPSSPSNSGNNNLPTFREEDEYEYQSYNINSTVNTDQQQTLAYSIDDYNADQESTGSYKESTVPYSYTEEETIQNNDILARIEPASAIAEMTQHDGAPTQPYNYNTDTEDDSISRTSNDADIDTDIQTTSINKKNSEETTQPSLAAPRETLNQVATNDSEYAIKNDTGDDDQIGAHEFEVIKTDEEEEDEFSSSQFTSNSAKEWLDDLL